MLLIMKLQLGNNLLRRAILILVSRELEMCDTPEVSLFYNLDSFPLFGPKELLLAKRQTRSVV
jgi:hypothetical protein